ncbi:hypothetical protein H6F56_20970 [Microcoleus sp. FACHB-672]|nr:hypothetical protein [Microcoleus sp. FACHB-672]
MNVSLITLANGGQMGAAEYKYFQVAQLVEELSGLATRAHAINCVLILVCLNIIELSAFC